jgi:hypothetical protein
LVMNLLSHRLVHTANRQFRLTKIPAVDVATAIDIEAIDIESANASAAHYVY